MDQVSIKPIRFLTEMDIFTRILSILLNRIDSFLHRDVKKKEQQLEQRCAQTWMDIKKKNCNHLSLSEKGMAAKISSSLD